MISEYKKTQSIDDLKRIQKSIGTLISVSSERLVMDIETHSNINGLYSMVMDVLHYELDKELSKQKSEGKEFISADDVDKMINEILKEENYVP